MMEEKKTMSTEQITYLQMIQGTIDRMSTSSAIFKGFCVGCFNGIYPVATPIETAKNHLEKD